MYRLSGQTAIIYLYSITRLIFVTETECVYCAVRTVSLSIVQVIDDAFSRRLLTAEALVRFQVSPCEICGGKSGTGTRFFSQYFGFTCRRHSTDASCSSSSLCRPYQRDRRTKPGNLPKKQRCFESWKALGRKLFSLFVSVFEVLTFRTCILPTHGVYAFHVTLVRGISFPSIELTDLSVLETRCVVCEVGTEFLFIWMNSGASRDQ